MNPSTDAQSFNAGFTRPPFGGLDVMPGLAAKPLRGKSCVWVVLALLAMFTHSNATAENIGTFRYQTGQAEFSYLVKQTGDNYTFEFSQNPGNIGQRLKAIHHVLQSVYEDASVGSAYRETFMKESAQCFVFAARFYSYRACFLPNDYSPDKKDRFWGFVTQFPNAAWLLTRQLLPALLAFGLIFYLWRRR